MEKVLLDTDILSESVKRIYRRVASKAIAYLAIFGRYTISVVTILEVVKGWHKLGREDKIQQFFAQIEVAEVLTLELSDAKLAGRIYADLERTGQPIGLADAIIAAIAIQQDLTKNGVWGVGCGVSGSIKQPHPKRGRCPYIYV